METTMKGEKQRSLVVSDLTHLNHSAREIISGSHDHLYTGTTYKLSGLPLMTKFLLLEGVKDAKFFLTCSPVEQQCK
ncbi:hypothetical protein L1887_19077 [Cichorium endivia]|nr:hypothetical protein L1887_29220 [Cichorium endivia]KAI3511916.1 hypothetical protein L1887_19077 [Cichorium endivia]